MKNKWGLGITIFYSCFVIIMVSFVFYSRGFTNDLVRDDYYQGDIEFQSKYEKLSNASKLELDLQIDLQKEGNKVLLNFPKNMQSITGQILFYRPDDKRLDFKIPIRTDDDNNQIVSMATHKNGFWKVEVDWKGDGKDYFTNEKIYY